MVYSKPHIQKAKSALKLTIKTPTAVQRAEEEAAGKRVIAAIKLKEQMLGMPVTDEELSALALTSERPIYITENGKYQAAFGTSIKGKPVVIERETTKPISDNEPSLMDGLASALTKGDVRNIDAQSWLESEYDQAINPQDYVLPKLNIPVPQTFASRVHNLAEKSATSESWYSYNLQKIDITNPTSIIEYAALKPFKNMVFSLAVPGEAISCLTDNIIYVISKLDGSRYLLEPVAVVGGAIGKAVRTGANNISPKLVEFYDDLPDGTKVMFELGVMAGMPKAIGVAGEAINNAVKPIFKTLPKTIEAGASSLMETGGSAMEFLLKDVTDSMAQHAGVRVMAGAGGVGVGEIAAGALEKTGSKIPTTYMAEVAERTTLKTVGDVTSKPITSSATAKVTTTGDVATNEVSVTKDIIKKPDHDIAIPENSIVDTIKYEASTTYTAREVVVENPHKIKHYVNKIEESTVVGAIHDTQIPILKDALRQQEFVKLDDASQKIHRSQFRSVKDKLIQEWTKETGKEWPMYEQDYFYKTGQRAREIGDPYDAHHVIPVSHGGPNEWWNMHPAHFLDEHPQIHADPAFKNLFNSKIKK